MDFAEFVAPMPVEDFLKDYYGKQPLHLSTGPVASRRSLLSWPRLGELLSILPKWTEGNIKLILNSRPVAPAHYMDEVDTHDGRALRADPAKVDVFLGMGASLVANAVEDVAPEVRRVASMLGDQFGAKAGANAYCSFKDVQAFDSHCDLHEVFAVHLEGEKTWRIYENRAESPVQTLEGDEAQPMIDRSKGAVMMEVTMKPGDLLYIPRGYFHDALASSEASLHLTFSVTPLNGRILFRILEELAMEDPDFRAYLPDAMVGDGAELRSRLEPLASKIGVMMRSGRFQTELAARQRALTSRPHRFNLPDRPKLNFYARTDRPADVVRRIEGASLLHQGGEIGLGLLGDAAEWAISQPAFSTQQLSARYSWLGNEEVGSLVKTLTDAGLFAPYRPAL